MKGLLYNSFLQNKTVYLVATIAFAVITIASSLVLGLNDNTESLLYMFMMFIPVLGPLTITCILGEANGKKTEKMLKCGFIKYTLTSGVSRMKYAAAELVENLATFIGGYALCAVMYAVLSLVGPDPIPPVYYRNCFMLVMLTAALMYLVTTLVLYIRDEQKASLLVGFVIGFLCLPLILTENEEGLQLEITDTVFWAGLGIAALIYAVCYFIMVHRLKRECT